MGENQTLARGKVPPVDKLTPSEQRIADLLGAGHTVQEIADATGMKKQSVRSRIATIREKLQVNGVIK